MLDLSLREWRAVRSGPCQPLWNSSASRPRELSQVLLGWRRNESSQKHGESSLFGWSQPFWVQILLYSTPCRPVPWHLCTSVSSARRRVLTAELWGYANPLQQQLECFKLRLAMFTVKEIEAWRFVSCHWKNSELSFLSLALRWICQNYLRDDCP